MRVVLTLLLVFFASPTFASSATTRDFSSFFAGYEGCFVLYDSQTDAYVRYNPAACEQRTTPCSTFKIANSLIAFDTGVAAGPTFSLKWDGVNRPIAAWNQDHTMRTAYADSVVWFYQELVRRVGPMRMSNYVASLNYGNGDTSGGITKFWLRSTLLISPDEQVDFLRRLWADKLPASKEAQRLTRELMKISDSKDGTVFYGKTGTGGSPERNLADLGWFVGCVEKGKRTVFFATRITGAPNASGREARRITQAILGELKILPK